MTEETEVIYILIQVQEEDNKILPSATTAKEPDISPETAHPRDKKDKTDLREDTTTKDLQDQNATTANKADIWLRTVKRSKLKRNVTTARRLDTSPETALKAETERKPLSATSVTKVDISLEIAKVKFKLNLD